MLFFTALAGILLGTLLGERVAKYALIVYYNRGFTNKDKFLDLYDMVDNEFHYDMYSATTDQPPKSYAEFLRLLQNKRPQAYKTYMYYLREARKHFALLLLMLVVIPVALLFWTFWYIYLAAFLLLVLFFVWRIRYKNENGLDFHVILMISVVLNYKKK